MDDGWTLDELTRRVAQALAGDDVRAPNARVREVPDARAIRWYATIGLVDRPLAFRRRTARYGPRHLLQIVAVKRRQAAGRTLAEIQAELTGATDPVLRRVARVPAALLDPAVSDPAVSDPTVSDAAVSGAEVLDAAVSGAEVLEASVSGAEVLDAAVLDPAVSKLADSAVSGLGSPGSPGSGVGSIGSAAAGSAPVRSASLPSASAASAGPTPVRFWAARRVADPVPVDPVSVDPVSVDSVPAGRATPGSTGEGTVESAERVEAPDAGTPDAATHRAPAAAGRDAALSPELVMVSESQAAFTHDAAGRVPAAESQATPLVESRYLIALAPGATLVLDAAPTVDELDAIQLAAAPLARLLARRGSHLAQPVQPITEESRDDHH